MGLKFHEELLYKIKLTDVYYEIDSISSANQWGEKYYGEWIAQYKSFVKDIKYVDSISYNSKSPIEAYCGYGHISLNNYLRNENESEKNNPYLQSFADILQVAICSAPKIPENIIVYRLVSDKVIDKLLSNQRAYIYYEKGFMSTSLYNGFYLNKDEHYTHFNNLLKIYVNAGTRALFISTIDDRNEGEVLFLPHTALALIKKPYKKDKKIIYECIML